MGRSNDMAGSQHSILVAHLFLSLKNFCRCVPQTPLRTRSASHHSGGGVRYWSGCVRAVYNKGVDLHRSGRDVNRKLGVAHGKLLLGIALP